MKHLILAYVNHELRDFKVLGFTLLEIFHLKTRKCVNISFFVLKQNVQNNCIRFCPFNFNFVDV